MDKPFKFETDCVHSTCEAITSMVESAKEITRKTFLSHCEVYEPRTYVPEWDYHIRYYKGAYKEKPCYFFVHSAIEHIFTKGEH